MIFKIFQFNNNKRVFKNLNYYIKVNCSKIQIKII